MSNEQIEQEIQAKGLTKPRVTLERIESIIVKEEYHRLTPVLTVCVLTLANDFTVTGESACASPENFDEEIGQKIARKMAVDKIWVLEGYLLKNALAFLETHGIPSKWLLDVNHPVQEDVVDSIARVTYEVNRAYCEAMGDSSFAPWDSAPDWQKETNRLGVLFHMGGDFGPEASHESWRTQKFNDGWRWGAVKDPEKKEHPCMMDFADLPKEQQAKDFLFRAVVHALR